MADDLIDRGANGFWKALVIKWCGDGFLDINDMVVAYSIKLSSGDPGDDMRLNHFQYFSCKAARLTHTRDILFTFNSYIAHVRISKPLCIDVW